MEPAVRIDVETPLEWWRPLMQWLLAVPHLAYTGVLSLAAALAGVAIAVAVLVTGRVPRRLAQVVALMMRERVRTFSQFWLLRRSYPAFATVLAEHDPGDDPLTAVSVAVPEFLPRSSPFIRPFLVLPHVVVLAPIGLVLDLAYPVLVVVAAVRRGWSAPMARFLVAVEQWVMSVLAYTFLVTDARPTFGLQTRTAALDIPAVRAAT